MCDDEIASVPNSQASAFSQPSVVWIQRVPEYAVGTRCTCTCTMSSSSMSFGSTPSGFGSYSSKFGSSSSSSVSSSSSFASPFGLILFERFASVS